MLTEINKERGMIVMQARWLDVSPIYRGAGEARCLDSTLAGKREMCYVIASGALADGG